MLKHGKRSVRLSFTRGYSRFLIPVKLSVKSYGHIFLIVIFYVVVNKPLWKKKLGSGDLKAKYYCQTLHNSSKGLHMRSMRQL